MSMPINPLILAQMSEDAIKKLMETVYGETRQISQLMVGRIVTTRQSEHYHEVTGVVVGKNGGVILEGVRRYGPGLAKTLAGQTSKRGKAVHAIGPLKTIEIVEPLPVQTASEIADVLVATGMG